jgi:hypothetical protein
VAKLGGRRFGGAGLVAIRLEKSIFVAGLVTTLGEGHFCCGIVGLVGEKGIFVGGLVATLGEGHFCGRISGYVGRRAFLGRD